MSKKISLRDYQIESKAGVKACFAKKKKRVVLCSPTGSGKTYTSTSIVSDTIANGNSVLFITDRRELHQQTGNAFTDFSLFPDFLTAKTKYIPTHKLIVCMLETLKRRLAKPEYVTWLQGFKLIIFDEAHKNSFNKVFEFLTKDQFIIGLTATPVRYGSQPALSNFYDEIVEVITTKQLIEKRNLMPARYYGVQVDLSNVRITAGEYDKKDLTKKYDDADLFHGVLDNWQKHTPNSKTLVFCASVENSVKLRDEFIAAGIKAEHLDANTPEKERKQILDSYKRNEFKVLCNVGILTTGYDEPEVETIVLYRATRSLILYLQMCGRGSRPSLSTNKEFFTILDFGNNIKRHGFWHDDREWGLENPKRKRNDREGVAPVKDCPECGAMIPVGVKFCEFCGYKYKVKEKEKIKVILERLNPKQVQAFAKNPDRTIKELEEIRELKGYKQGWILHKFSTLDEFIEYGKLKGYKAAWAYYKAKDFLGNDAVKRSRVFNIVTDVKYDNLLKAAEAEGINPRSLHYMLIGGRKNLTNLRYEHVS